MVDLRRDVLRPPHCTTPAAVKANINRNSFKSNENIHEKENGSYYVVSANKASCSRKTSMKLAIYIHCIYKMTLSPDFFVTHKAPVCICEIVLFVELRLDKPSDANQLPAAPVFIQYLVCEVGLEFEVWNTIYSI